MPIIHVGSTRTDIFEKYDGKLSEQDMIKCSAIARPAKKRSHEGHVKSSCSQEDPNLFENVGCYVKLMADEVADEQTSQSQYDYSPNRTSTGMGRIQRFGPGDPEKSSQLPMKAEA
ncbi:hypothetical protein ACJRO7_008249 [Eucalyptus globulus]|uniref:Uncharacterized protein n=1 Tax=Eucalyptus globulus TaxID=34317 RepID=A0ABD3IRE8_EUCGL